MATKATNPVFGMTVEESPTTPRISYQGAALPVLQRRLQGAFHRRPGPIHGEPVKPSRRSGP